MVAPNNNYETNARNHYYDDCEREAAERRAMHDHGGWTLPSFDLMGWAYWLGKVVGACEFHWEQWRAAKRQARRQQTTRDNAEPAQGASDGTIPKKN